MKKMLVLFPSYGFDPAEAAIPRKVLPEKGYLILQHRNHLSACWLGDVYSFALKLADMLGN